MTIYQTPNVHLKSGGASVPLAKVVQFALSGLVVLALCESLDFGARALPFRISTFIVAFTLLQAGIVIASLWRPTLITLKINRKVLGVLVVTFLCINVILISVLINLKAVNVGRWLLLVMQFIFACQIGILAKDNLNKVLVGACKVYVILCIPILIGLYLFPDVLMQFNSEYLDLSRHVLSYEGAYLPRFRGLSLDSNRGGFDFLLMLSIFNSGATKQSLKWKLLLAIFAVLSLSRSVVISLLVYIVGQFLFVRISRARIKSFLKYAAAICLLVAVLFFLLPDETKTSISKALLQRISLEESSANEHFSTYEIGVSLIMQDPIRFLVGFGPGSGAAYLQEIFESKYANFHSGYMHVLFEHGLFIFIVSLLALMPGLLNRKLPILAYLFFSIFYQYFGFLFYLANFEHYKRTLTQESRLNRQQRGKSAA